MKESKLRSEWLEQGYFNLESSKRRITHTHEIRDHLANLLKMDRASLKRRGYPVHQNFRHTLWWREGEHNFAEAQFAAYMDRSAPMMMLGLTVEKGIESNSPTSGEFDLMDRAIWDWPKFVNVASRIVNEMIPECVKKVGKSAHLGIHAFDQDSKPKNRDYYSCTGKEWFRRHEGAVDSGRVVGAINDLDEPDYRNCWVDVYIGCFYSPAEVGEMTTKHAAEILAAFAPVRSVIRGQKQGG